MKHIWSKIKKGDRMLQTHFADIVEEMGLTDTSDATLEEFLAMMRAKFGKFKATRMTFGQMVRLQEWFGWNKTVRTEIIPNWTCWLLW